jgi:glycosyltransferase involved in cell wall biosynthesis
MITYSWVVPIHNEALSLTQLFSEIKKVMGDKKYEIIAINDGSTDQSLKVLKALKKTTPQLQIISCSAHLGKWASLNLGFKKISGKIIITIDSDLQDDPKELPKLLKYLKTTDLISGQRAKRFDPLYKVFFSKLGNKLTSLIHHKDYFDLNSPFKVYKKGVLLSIPTQGSMFRFSLLFADKLGYKTKEVPITHRPRIYGKSKFGLKKYLRIVYDLFLLTLLFSGSGSLKRSR